MKTLINRKGLGLLLMQLAVWGAMILVPTSVILFSTRNTASSTTFMGMLWFNLQSPFLLYFINFYILWPLLFAKRRYVLFLLADLAAFLALNKWLLHFSHSPSSPDIQLPDNAWLGMFSGVFVYFLLNLASISAAIVLRHFLRTRQIKKQLEEERHKNTEAELAWLKNQINPHFLFNTLNNISSLTQIDADQAQDAIAQLSDLLRYTMYETNKPKVSIGGEVEFMRNYIELMKLRCNKMTTVTSRFNVGSEQAEVAPLLFISLIENAFKHGVNSSEPATIDINLEQHDGLLTFVCDNTNNPKPAKDHSGSGIGLENTRRRFNLIYPGRYTWEQTVTPDNIYHVKITINL